MKTYKLVCRVKDCDTVMEMRLGAEPTEGWHEVNDLGRIETHHMTVEEVPED